MVLVNYCRSDVSPVNNSDSGAFGYFLRIINWSPIHKSAQQVSNKKSNDIGRDTMHWTSDGFAYLYQWIYSCRIAGKFTSNFRSRACLTIPSWSSITIYRNTLRPFWTLDHFGPSFRSHLLSFWSKFEWHFAPQPHLSHCVLVSCHFDILTFPLSFFKEIKALLALIIIFLKILLVKRCYCFFSCQESQGNLLILSLDTCYGDVQWTLTLSWYIQRYCPWFWNDFHTFFQDFQHFFDHYLEYEALNCPKIYCTTLRNSTETEGWISYCAL